MSNFDHIWNEKQRAEAASEGWCLAFVVNAGRPVHTGYLDIFDVGPKFPNRNVAVKFVLSRAHERSKLHIEALSACSASRMDAAARAQPKQRKRA